MRANIQIGRENQEMMGEWIISLQRGVKEPDGQKA